MNNIALISSKLSRTIGNTTDITDTNIISILSGDLDNGCLIFDGDGTVGICTNFVRDQDNNPVYTVRTSSINTEIDIEYLLSQNY